MKKRIYIAYTGGTIGMKRVNGAYQPVPNYLQELMAANPAFQHADLPDYTIRQYEPLLDSSNMTPADWTRIGQDICRNYDNYDGFIVLHGTDTMAYTASALAFMLADLDKPVILTGSQIPLCEIRNDAQDNLITSLLIAANEAIPEVCLFFDIHLFRGCRTVKVNASGFDAFDSPNFLPLATAGTHITVNKRLVRQAVPASGVCLQPIGETAVVGALRLFPGISANIVENILQPPLRGLVLETYGSGNAPTNDQPFLDALAEAAARGVVIVDCTQCLRGTVNLAQYATGSALAEAGVISGYDMTAEAALTKLAFLLSRNLPIAEVKRLMLEDLRGELTRP
ncbi:MAG: asparaginase [Anaerolineae bacterium]